MTPRACGLLLAAGAGRRMGRPKALVADAGGPWPHRALDALAAGGCDGLLVVLGAQADDARDVVASWPGRPAPQVVVADDWADGMGASLRAGLAHLAGTSYDVALVTLVDLPDVGADVVRRVLDAAGRGRATLARATYGGVPGHPVVLGADRWAAAADVARGDRGARDLLAGDDVRLVECGDLATGADVDTATDPGTRGAEGGGRG
ncbi:nucleotidyltransferase family protein [Lapillicoccus jejuensis]|uniref:Nicotine blue oxidoreductase n=1 Tax=Lapillicoccus jejuensis TaxID=402171 RepID=A0A542E5E7_9MICO|nr:nucleotidyltransferase family protein [Lapillicoccus jejuensis]TQJ10516.1 nicotine blue oxidoreductase [Lapillicoccus jejuensis]